MNYLRLTKYYLLKLFRISDSPSAIGRGFAMGIIVHFYPIFGFGLPMALFTAQLVRGSIAASGLGWAVTSPLWPPFFYLNFLVGDWVLGNDTEDIIQAIYNVAHAHFSDLLIIGKAFFLGAIINTIVTFVIIRWLVFVMVSRYRKEILVRITKLPAPKRRRN